MLVLVLAVYSSIPFKSELDNVCVDCTVEQCYDCAPPPGGGVVLPEKLGMGMWPSYQNPYLIYDRFSLPYL